MTTNFKTMSYRFSERGQRSLAFRAYLIANGYKYSERYGIFNGKNYISFHVEGSEIDHEMLSDKRREIELSCN